MNSQIKYLSEEYSCPVSLNPSKKGKYDILVVTELNEYLLAQGTYLNSYGDLERKLDFMLKGTHNKLKGINISPAEIRNNV